MKYFTIWKYFKWLISSMCSVDLFYGPLFSMFNLISRMEYLSSTHVLRNMEDPIPPSSNSATGFWWSTPYITGHCLAAWLTQDPATHTTANKVLALNVVQESQHNTMHSLSVCVTNNNPLMIVCHEEYYLSCTSLNFLGHWEDGPFACLSFQLTLYKHAHILLKVMILSKNAWP